MKYAITTLRFEYFYQKCINFCHEIPPVPAIGQEFEYNVPWTFSQEFDRKNHVWTEIKDWEQQWCELKQKGNDGIVDKISERKKKKKSQSKQNGNNNNNNNNNNNSNEVVVHSVGDMNSDNESEMDINMNGMQEEYDQAVVEHKLRLQQLESEYQEKVRKMEQEMSQSRLRLENQIQKDTQNHKNKMKQFEVETKNAKNEIRKLEIEKEKQHQKIG